MSNRQFRVEEKEGGRLFHLRNEVKLLVKWHSEKQLQVELWRDTEVLAPDVGNLYTSSFRERLVKAAERLFPIAGEPRLEHQREAALGQLAEDIGDAAIMLNQPTPSGQTMHALLERSGPSVAEKLVRYARASAKFFHTPDREAFAAVKIGGHVEHYRVGSRDFKLWVQNEFWTNEKRRAEEAAATAAGAMFDGEVALPEVVRDQALTDAVRLLEGFAIFEGPEAEVYRRIAGHDGRIYVDLGDADWRVVEVSPEGWEVIPGHEAPVKFVRKRGGLPLPEPVNGGSVAPLKDLLHLGEGPERERNWRLIVSWLVHALTPYGPYTVLALLGNQGAAKSTTQRILRNLIDPNVSPLRRKPREDRDLYIAAVNGWVISLDNMSGVPEWLSDALCALATGSGLGVRKLYSDDEEVLLDAMRPIMLNGIGDIVSRPDLLSRAVIVRLPGFPDHEEDNERMDEETLFAKAQEIAPGVLGALLSAVSHYLKVVGEIKRTDLPRMVDFAKAGIASEEALGGEKGSFMRAYKESRDEATDTALEVWPIAQPVIDFARRYSQGKPWEGRASEFLTALNDTIEDDALKRAADWPKQANQLSGQLNRLAPDLLQAGVHIERFKEHNKQRMLRIFFHQRP